MSDTNGQVAAAAAAKEVEVAAAAEGAVVAAEAVLCSICLDEVVQNANRPTAKLSCGHEFHLDCIGSAFNFKGTMQCPNCRHIESGRWLYRSGPLGSFPQTLVGDLIVYGEQYSLSYPEILFNIRRCPFSGLAAAYPAFGALESYPLAFSYVPHHSSVPQSHFLWGNNTYPHISQQAPVAPVTHQSFMHPFLFGHGSLPHERSQPSQVIHHPHQLINPLGMPAAINYGMARSYGQMTLPPSTVPANSVSDQNGGFYIFPSRSSSVQSSQEVQNSQPVILARQDSSASSVHSGAGSSSNSTFNFWNGHRS